jgi:DNA-binding LacI/PurR family transcriptional regulator
MATIKDVAAQAGVAISTVSHALNRTAPVSDKTRRRVEQAAKKLKYKPSSLGRSLVSRRTNTMCLVIADPAKGFVHSPVLNWINGIYEATATEGYNILLNIDKCDRGYVELVETKAVDGLILTSPRVDDKEYLEIARRRFPFVLMGRSDSPIRMNSVDIDNFSAVYMATKYLLELGHRTIGFIAPGAPQFIYSQDRICGFKQATSEYECFRNDLVVYSNLYPEAGASAAEELLRVAPDLTAIFAGDDVIIPGIYSLLSSKGFRIPDDVSVMGFGDLSYASSVYPQASSVHVPFYSIGVEAGKLLLDAISGDAQVIKSMTMETKLVIRGSTQRIR